MDIIVDSLAGNAELLPDLGEGEILEQMQPQALLLLLREQGTIEAEQRRQIEKPLQKPRCLPPSRDKQNSLTNIL